MNQIDLIYCHRCRQHRPVTGATLFTVNGARALKGACQTCAAEIYRVVSNEAPVAAQQSVEQPSAVYRAGMFERLRFRLAFLFLIASGKIDEAMLIAILAQKKLGSGVLPVTGRQALLVRAGLAAGRLLERPNSRLMAQESPEGPEPQAQLPNNVVRLGQVRD